MASLTKRSQSDAALQTARTTFAKPRPAPTPSPADAGRRSALGPFGNPYVGAGTAAAFFIVCAAALVSLTGDPRAGTPVVRLSLAKIAETSAPPGWLQALPTETPGDAPFDSATVELSSVATDSADAGAPGGQAIITISGDTKVDGAQAAATGSPLIPAPIAGLFAQGAAGMLPVIGPDGRTPAQAYARAALADGKPKVALIIGGLGLNAKATHEAIEGLPPEVTLSFVPYADGLQGWIDAARAAGHEVLLEAPMEPKEYPQNDPGPADLGNLSVSDFDEVFKKYPEVYPQMIPELLRIRATTAEEYWVPSLRAADAHLKGGGTAFVYRLDFAETGGYLRGYAFHSLDVRLVWDRPSALAENAQAEADLALQMHHAWVAFLRGEAPAAPGIPAWPAYNAVARPTMVFDTQNHVEQKPQEAELRLWDGIL